MSELERQNAIKPSTASKQSEGANARQIRANKSGSAALHADGDVHQQNGKVGHPTLEENGNQHDNSISGDVRESYSLAQLCGALEALVDDRNDRGRGLENLPIHDLVKFLYLGGQAKAS